MKKWTASNQWDKRFLEMAKLVAGWSKDPSTKVGCVLVDDKKQVLSLGFNGFPRGMADDARLFDKTEKHKFVIHAEENALIGYDDVNASGATAYVWPLQPCPRCAAKLVQAGIKRVVTVIPSTHHQEKYGLLDVTNLFEECDIIFDIMEPLC